MIAIQMEKFDCLPCKDLLQGVARVWMSWLRCAWLCSFLQSTQALPIHAQLLMLASYCNRMGAKQSVVYQSDRRSG